MNIVGIDLSGPTNVRDSTLVVFRSSGEELVLDRHISGADDAAIYAALKAYDAEEGLVVGVDAPLSYNPGGGDRPGDSELRALIIEAGMHAGSIMAPTMTRMAYLTLRGMAVARLICALNPTAQIVEVHPGAAMALHGAPVQDVRELKRSSGARIRLLSWLESQGMNGLKGDGSESDHDVAAYAAACAAWRWHQGESAWIKPAALPFHPFDYAC